VALKIEPGFAVWITGLPASGKSTLAAAIRVQLAERGVDVAVLESDELRKVLTPNPSYDDAERERFYRQMTYIGVLLTAHGVPVIFDATANRRAYRDMARRQISRFVEVYVHAPIEVCIARDPKGIYHKANSDGATAVPGLQAEYEAPECPDLVVHADSENPDRAAARLICLLAEKRFAVSGIKTRVSSDE
jgi:adenylylsulfate kinase